MMFHYDKLLTNDKTFRNTYYNLISLCLLVSCGIQEKNQPDIKFDFDGSIKNENYQLKDKGFDVQ